MVFKMNNPFKQKKQIVGSPSPSMNIPENRKIAAAKKKCKEQGGTLNETEMSCDKKIHKDE